MHRHQRYEAEEIYKTAISITSLSTILNSHRKPPALPATSIPRFVALANTTPILQNSSKPFLKANYLSIKGI